MTKAALVALGLLATMGSAHAQRAADAPGRYQIVMNPNAAVHTYLLDTATGRIWQLSRFTFLNGDPQAWDIMERLDNGEEYRGFVSRHGRKTPAAPTPAPR